MTENKKWYVVYTKPRCEKKVHGLFEEKHIESYCPLNKVSKKWSDRIKIVEEPLFKSYVFVKIDEETQPKVRMTNGVVNFVYWQGKPAVVRNEEIDTIRKFLNEYKNVYAAPLDLKPGMQARISSGILMDKQATVLQVHGNKVQVNIESIGYSLVATVDKSNLATI